MNEQIDNEELANIITENEKSCDLLNTNQKSMKVCGLIQSEFRSKNKGSK